MEIWVQYTLDLMDKDKPEGTLTLGGWGTDEICYKFVSSRKHDNSGYHHGQQLISEEPERVFCAEIQRLSWRVRKFNNSKKSTELIYSDDFLYVYKVSESYEGKYNPRTGEWERHGPILVGLVAFVKTVPVHLAQPFKTFLKDIIDHPKTTPPLDKDPVIAWEGT